jgi:hypothetical protein
MEYALSVLTRAYLYSGGTSTYEIRTYNESYYQYTGTQQ